MLAAIILIGVPAAPLLLAAALAVPSWRATVLRIAPWAALPGLAVAVSGWPVDAVDLPALLVGTTLGLDETRRLFLGFTAGLWLIAGHYAAGYHANDDRRVSHQACFLATQAGNLLLIVAADAVTFYLGFLTMSLAAYGLIVHAGTDAARRAGKVYLVLVVLGEALVLPALWLGIAGAESLAPEAMAAALQHDDLAMGLLLAGLGIKAGLVPLHVWLPLAHPVAPTPASAVLSGAMVKAGLLGWLTLLPVGTVTRPDIGLGLIVLGLLGAFGAALCGVVQARAKAVLAYSTVSQMGLMIATFGMAWYSPEAAVPALAAISIYALHHALAKGALFLGVGCVEAAATPRARRRVLALLLLPALALAGAPLTSGAVAKVGVKHALPELPDTLYALLGIALPLAAVGTTLLMARFLWLALRLPSDGGKRGLQAPWMLLCGAVAVVCLLPAIVPGERIAEALSPATWWAAIWPIAVGGGMAWLAVRFVRRYPDIPEGDLLWVLVAIATRARQAGSLAPARRVVERLAQQGQGLSAQSADQTARWLDRTEAVLTRWPTLVAAMLVIMAAVWLPAYFL